LETLAKPPSPPPQTPSKLQRNELRFELYKAALTGILANSLTQDCISKAIELSGVPAQQAEPLVRQANARIALKQADAALAEWEKNQT
jgi:hypothetical protein